MKKLLTLILFLPYMNLNAASGFMLGSTLLSVCDKNTATYKSDLCVGYILGVLDTHLNNNELIFYSKDNKDEIEEFKDNDRYTPFRECNVSKLQSSPVVIDYVYNFLSIQNSENLNTKAGFLLTLAFDYALDCGKEDFKQILMENALGINFPKEKLTD